MSFKHDPHKVKWSNDPEILARLEVVSELMLEGAKGWQIMQSISATLPEGETYSWATAKRDMQRVRILWGQASEAEVIKNRDRSINQYRLIIQRAWRDYANSRVQPTGPRNTTILRTIIDAENHIAELQGTKSPILYVNLEDMSDEQLDALSKGKVTSK